jgi:hypothetical protein
LINNDGIPFDYVAFPTTLAMASEVGANGIFVQVACVVPIVTISFFIIDALVVDRQ